MSRHAHTAVVFSLPDGSRIEHPTDVVSESTVREWMRLAWQGEVPEGAVVHIEEVK